MLDILRKKAQTWFTKVVFGIIILVFVFFFGYNRISKKYGSAGKNVVATVNGHVITRPEFKMAYENVYKMYQNAIKIEGKEDNELPPELEKSVRKTALNQLVSQVVENNIGRKLGLAPTDEELVDVIRRSSVAKTENGEFDFYLYKTRFLPYFSQKYGIDYEYVVANDLLEMKVRSLFDLFAKASEKEVRDAYNLENTKWTFDVLESDSAKGLAKAKAKKVGPVSIGERNNILPGEPLMDVWLKVFGLTKDHPALAEPVQSNGKFYKVKVVKFEAPSEEKWGKEKGAYMKNFEDGSGRMIYQAWLDGMLKKASIKTYLEE